MNVLLDTHAFIWYAFSPDKLSTTALDTINDHENAVSISQVSIWEMQIKSSLGKLRLPVTTRELVEVNVEQNDLSLLHPTSPI